MNEERLTRTASAPRASSWDRGKAGRPVAIDHLVTLVEDVVETEEEFGPRGDGIRNVCVQDRVWAEGDRRRRPGVKIQIVTATDAVELEFEVEFRQRFPIQARGELVSGAAQEGAPGVRVLG